MSVVPLDPPLQLTGEYKRTATRQVPFIILINMFLIIYDTYNLSTWFQPNYYINPQLHITGEYKRTATRQVLSLQGYFAHQK